VTHGRAVRDSDGGGAVDVVLKVGGALLRDPAAFDRAATTLARLPRATRIVLVPGGGIFADTVRELDRCLALGDDAAHWMAVLAMNQYAHVLGARIAHAAVVEDPAVIDAALAAGRVPILAPYAWLRRADPLPHAWDVTSDSIAAWIAIALHARHLVLLKPVAGPALQLSDAHLAHVLETAAAFRGGGTPTVAVCTADDVIRAVSSLAVT